MTFAPIALATVAAFSVGASASVLSGPVTNPANGHTYYLLQRGSWMDAQQEAMSLGGNLVTVNDAAENAFVLNTFGATAVNVSPGGGLVSLWLGLSDWQQEGNFVWADGSPGGYTNYQPGEPAGHESDEDYVGMAVGHTSWTPGVWHDIVADTRFGDQTYGVVEVVPVACPPDIGQAGGIPGADGSLDNNDFIVFVNYFFEQAALADRGEAGGLPGHDGQFDNNDFIVFINQFFDGC